MAGADVRFTLRGGESWRDPWDDYRRLREEDPVHLVEHPTLGRFWVLSRFADVFDAARDTATFSSAQGLTPGGAGAAMFSDDARPIVMMDPPDHTAMRRLVSKAMTPRRVQANAGIIESFVLQRLDRVAEHHEVDIIDALFKPLPSLVVAHHLGVPEADRGRFDRWTQTIVAANAADDLGSASDAFGELFAYGDELIDQRRRHRGDDLVSLLVEAGDSVSPGWIVGFVFTMITGGNDTTTGLLGGTALLLTRRRDQRRLLLEDPSLIGPAIDEFLRLTTPVQNLARTTTRAVEVAGTTVPAGEKVLLLYGSANRDEREFGPDAGDLDVRRSIDKMLAFGYGAHHCLGASAARLQATIALERLLERFPDFAVDDESARFAPGAYVRRFESLPLRPAGS
ncbi:MAG TPA: cytochrome P450 [Acidimicrobiales bacterium]|nr:cytochrome P450 [Acidimicrobiales bacterium]